MGPTLIATSTKFRLGAEIQSPTGLYLVFVYYFVTDAFLRLYDTADELSLDDIQITVMMLLS